MIPRYELETATCGKVEEAQAGRRKDDRNPAPARDSGKKRWTGREREGKLARVEPVRGGEFKFKNKVERWRDKRGGGDLRKDAFVRSFFRAGISVLSY